MRSAGDHVRWKRSLCVEEGGGVREEGGGVRGEGGGVRGDGGRVGGEGGIVLICRSHAVKRHSKCTHSS